MPDESQHQFDHARRAGFGPSDDIRRQRAQGALVREEVAPAPGAAPEPIWMALSYEAVRQVMGDHVRFSNQRRFRAQAIRGGSKHRPQEMSGHLMDYDQPEHTRLRKMLTPEFTVRRIQRLKPVTEAIAERCLDAMERKGRPADLVELYASPISGAVLCELLGVPRDDRREFLVKHQWQLEQDRSRKERAAAQAYTSNYLRALVKRQRKDPDEGFIGQLIRDHGDNFDDEELIGICGLMVLAGLDNVNGMISLGVLALLEHPDQLAVLLADPDNNVDRVVDELLRFLSVAHAPTPRTAVEDVVVAGQLIKAGEEVVCSIPMANRDPVLAPDVDRFDVNREPLPHIAFGHGIHHCIGAALGRMELRTAYLALWRRFPDLRLAVPADQVPHKTNSIAYGLERLPVAW
ncbi:MULTISPECIES: cytochrome P450 [Streptomyces]|uniref:cytochrome P450 n=1 Tax=Streptomyces TaxID=1883 RepID=UPI0004CCC7C3|nr:MULTISPECIES: cytochrome P450 [Streptomyces]KOT56572.1 cytochrome P450 [Streptomyces rimosus subsp. rimosus]